MYLFKKWEVPRWWIMWTLPLWAPYLPIKCSKTQPDWTWRCHREYLVCFGQLNLTSPEGGQSPFLKSWTKELQIGGGERTPTGSVAAYRPFEIGFSAWGRAKSGMMSLTEDWSLFRCGLSLGESNGDREPSWTLRMKALAITCLKDSLPCC